MEETVRRTVPRRSAASYKRKNKPIYNYRLIRKVLAQLIISSLILVCIMSINRIDTPFTQKVSSGINEFLNNSLDYKSIYQSAGDLISKAIAAGKTLFHISPVTKAVPGDDAGKDTKDVPVDLIKNTTETKTGTETASKPIVPVLSSIESTQEDAKSIKAMYKLALPVKGPVTSGFGIRINPITKKEEFHPGVDIKANQGTPILAAITGEVVESRKGTTFGNFIRINSGKDIQTVYAHCSKLNVKKGQKVSRGQKIGEVGNTGMSQGAHLHFEAWKGDRVVDPSYLYSQYK